MATEILRPNAAGDYTNIDSQEPETGAHWDKVDESIPDEEASVVYTYSAIQQKDAYNLEATSIPVGSVINSVKVCFRILEDEGYSYYQPFLRLSSNETAGTEINPLAYAEWNTYNEVLARPGGGNWQLSDLNNLQVVVGGRDETEFMGALFTQVYVEVDYSVALAGGSRGYIIG